jgi:hypothetical protein
MPLSGWRIETLAENKLVELRAEALASRLASARGWRARLAMRLRTLADRLEPTRRTPNGRAASPI